MRTVTTLRLIVALGLSCGAAHAGPRPRGPLGTSPAADTVQDDALRATTAPPWNPATPLARRRLWERAVLLPGRIVSLPLSALGAAADRSLNYAEDHNLLSIGSSLVRPGGGAVAVTIGGLGDRTGLGPAARLRTRVAPLGLPLGLEARGAVTYQQYTSALLGVTAGPLALEGDHDWRPRERFYGVGGASSRGDRTDYAVERTDARLAWRWASEDSGAFGARDQVEAWAASEDQVMRHGRETGTPTYAARFPDLGAALEARRIDHMVYGLRASLDRRTGAPHWGSGGRLLASIERHADPVTALALHTGQDEGARFTRVLLEGEGGRSFGRDPRTLRLMVRLMDQTVDARRDRFLPSDMATLGGRAGLGGYDPGRFHDLDLALARLTYLFPLGRWTEFDVHSEAGAVYANVWRDASLATLRPSFGVALRARTDRRVLGAIGVDVGKETVRMRYVLGAPE